MSSDVNFDLFKLCQVFQAFVAIKLHTVPYIYIYIYILQMLLIY